MKNNICITYSYKKTKIGDNLILTEFPENLHEAGYTFIDKYNNPFLKYNPYVTKIDYNEVLKSEICIEDNRYHYTG